MTDHSSNNFSRASAWTAGRWARIVIGLGALLTAFERSYAGAQVTASFCLNLATACVGFDRETQQARPTYLANMAIAASIISVAGPLSFICLINNWPWLGGISNLAFGYAAGTVAGQVYNGKKYGFNGPQ